MTYTFGLFEFDSGHLELRKAGRLVPLEPQPARALSLLLKRAGETVSREDLAAHIWGNGTYVDHNRGLAYCVGQIRAAVGDEGDNPRFVQTLPRRGFKFVAPVSVSRRSDPAPSAASIMPGGCVQPSGAVKVRPRAVAMGVAVVAVLLVAILTATFGARAFRVRTRDRWMD